MMTGLIILGVTVLLVWWVSCSIGGRADEDIDRYFAEQGEKVRLHGCATKISRP